jgi:hypothetical protein
VRQRQTLQRFGKQRGRIFNRSKKLMRFDEGIASESHFLARLERILNPNPNKRGEQSKEI